MMKSEWEQMKWRNSLKYFPEKPAAECVEEL